VTAKKTPGLLQSPGSGTAGLKARLYYGPRGVVQQCTTPLSVRGWPRGQPSMRR